jgi:hypothetical protein
MIEADCESHDGSYISSEEGFETASIDNLTAPLSIGEKFALREARFVRLLRLGLLVVLFSASLLATNVAYLSLTAREQLRFKDAFYDFSFKLTTEFQNIANRRLGAIAAFSTTITSNAISTNATWPFVTIANYEAQVRHIAKLADIQGLAFGPIVTSKQRMIWEQEFVPQNANKWISESFATKVMNGGIDNVTLFSYKMASFNRSQNESDRSPFFRDTIYEPKTSPDGELSFGTVLEGGPFMPLWQIAPFIPGADESSFNFDFNNDVTFDGDVISIISRHKAGLGRYTKRGYGKYDLGSPTSGFYYPVLKGLSQNSTVGGTLGTLFYWLPFFSNILPESATGLIGVLENTCNQVFTFQIDGAKVTFVDDNDSHDPKYDSLKRQVSFLSLLTESIDNKTYLGFPVDDTGCQYSLSVYPSSEFEKIYVTNQPIVASMVVLTIFFTTALLFVLYDRVLARRQRHVQKEAEASGAIVLSLFPAAYHDRLMSSAKARNRTINGKMNPKALFSNLLVAIKVELLMKVIK